MADAAAISERATHPTNLVFFIGLLPSRHAPGASRDRTLLTIRNGPSSLPIALMGQILATRSLHPSHHNPRNDLTEQAEVLFQKADWRSPLAAVLTSSRCATGLAGC